MPGINQIHVKCALERCSVHFVPTRRFAQKYCCDSCRQLAYQERIRLKNRGLLKKEIEIKASKPDQPGPAEQTYFRKQNKIVFGDNGDRKVEKNWFEMVHALFETF